MAHHSPGIYERFTAYMPGLRSVNRFPFVLCFPPVLPSLGSSAFVCSCWFRLNRASSITEALTPSYLSLQMPCPLPWLSVDALSARIESHLLKHLCVISFATFSIAGVAAASRCAAGMKPAVDESSASEGLDQDLESPGDAFIWTLLVGATSAGVRWLHTAVTRARFSIL